MPFSVEDIKSQIKIMNELLDDIEILMHALTNVFMLNYEDFEMSPEELMILQMYMTSLSAMIPELRNNLRLMEKGEFDSVDFTINVIDLMEDYVSKTKNQFEYLIKKFNLQDKIN
jgi:hypothetical protein